MRLIGDEELALTKYLGKNKKLSLIIDSPAYICVYTLSTKRKVSILISVEQLI